jgi:hypothetical protein
MRDPRSGGGPENLHPDDDKLRLATIASPCDGRCRASHAPAFLRNTRIRAWPPIRPGVGLTAAALVEHPRHVLRLLQRLAAVVLTLALVAGNAGICAGWMPTAEARMACCAEGGDCPMHKGNSQSSGSARVLTQAQADSCCALSERENSNQSNSSFVAAITAAVLGVGIVLPASVPALVLSDAWRTSAPIPVAPVPKHVLLSVFLV